MQGLSSIVASRSRCNLKNLDFQTNGGSLTWYAPTATRLTHYFNPLHQPKNPLFTKSCHPKSYFFHTVQNFGNFSLKDPKSAVIEKKVPKCLLFIMAFVTERPPIFCLDARVWGECCSLKHGQKLENFVFLKQNRAVWWILLGANSIKVMKTKFHFYRLNRPNCVLWMNFIWGQGWYTGRHLPVKHGRGYISYNYPLYDSAHLGSLNKCQVYLRLCEQRHFKCKVQCQARWRARENFEI